MCVRLGRFAEASQAITSALEAARDDLERTIVDVCAGNEPPDSAFAKCRTGCDLAGAEYYAAVVASLNGQHDAAAQLFRRSISAGCVTEAEHELARARFLN